MSILNRLVRLEPENPALFPGKNVNVDDGLQQAPLLVCLDEEEERPRGPRFVTCLGR
jgi:hypothetical protein